MKTFLALAVVAVIASPAPTATPFPGGRFYVIREVTTRTPYLTTQSIDAGPFETYNDCMKVQHLRQFTFTPTTSESYMCEVRYPRQQT